MLNLPFHINTFIYHHFLSRKRIIHSKQISDVRNKQPGHTGQKGSMQERSGNSKV